MAVRALWVVIIALSWVVQAVAAEGARVPAAQEGLVRIDSGRFDELWLRAEAEFAAYRSVLIDPVRVSFQRNWFNDMNSGRNMTRRVTQEEAERIARDRASSLQRILSDVFRQHGYEIAAAAGPGVLRLSPRIDDLYVNAPGRESPWLEKTFTRDAGEAILVLEIRDAASDALLGRVKHHGTADQMRRFERANDATNRFWFDALFSRWAADCVAELQARSHRAQALNAPQALR